MRLVAIDLGSNSFRLEIGQVVGRQIVTESSLKARIRLASGLDSDNRLSREVQENALAALSRFREKIRHIPEENIRIVGTQTFRVAKNIEPFLTAAEKILAHKIELLSGTEEARLSYLGCAHTLPPDNENRLVVDIGGASTEIVLGREFRVLLAKSIELGCVNCSLRFFADGVISQDRFLQARDWARAQFQSVRTLFQGKHWHHVYGSAGTVSAVATIGEALGLGDGRVTKSLLTKLAEKVLTMQDFSQIRLPGLKESRREVIVGGLALMQGLFEAFDIEEMTVAKGAVRYGILYELLENKPISDLKEAAIAQLIERFPTNREEIGRILRRSQLFFNAITKKDLNVDAPEVLRWAATLCKTGQCIRLNEYPKHSHYIFTNTNLPEFTKNEREKVAMLLLAQSGDLTQFREILRDPKVQAMTLSLRLAVLFCARYPSFDFETLQLSRTDLAVTIKIPRQWFCEHDLLQDKLEREASYWTNIGYRFLLEKI